MAAALISRSLPLGIDIGTRRLRVVRAELRQGTPWVRAIAVRELSEGSASSGIIDDPPFVAALLEEAVEEVGGRERRCVCAIGEPDAILRTMRMPKMGAVERTRAARFEAQRYVEYPAEEAVVRIRRLDDGETLYALGVARSVVVESRARTLRTAGLRPVAMDHEWYAFARAFEGFDAVVDVGYRRLGVHILASPFPLTYHSAAAAAEVTFAIARDLAIDETSAEKRKRILGTAGAGEGARKELAAAIGSAIDAGRRRGNVVRRVAFAGNGTRLPGLLSDVERGWECACEVSVALPLRNCAYPDDVVRSGAPDWALAAGLSMWCAE